MLRTDVISATFVSILDALFTGHPGHIVTYLVLYLEAELSRWVFSVLPFPQKPASRDSSCLVHLWSEYYSLTFFRHEVSPYSQYCW